MLFETCSDPLKYAFSLFTTATIATTAINYLQMRKLKLRVVSSLAQAYIASKQQSYDLNSGLSDSPHPYLFQSRTLIQYVVFTRNGGMKD